MNPKLLLEQTSDGITLLTINRPVVHNALDWETQEMILHTLQDLVEENTTRVLILTGTGGTFCAGGDLSELANFGTYKDGERLAIGMGQALYLLENAPFPTIAALNGAALGGGAELAVACDLRVMDETAKIGFVQLKMGVTPGWGGGQRLLRQVGYNRALHLLLRAQPIDAAQAFEWGLVEEIAPPGSALACAQQLAKHITAWDVDAVAATKRILRAGCNLPYREAQAVERAEFPPLWAAEAHLRAVDTFLNRKTSL
jgi:enoyl-CoA hydratase